MWALLVQNYSGAPQALIMGLRGSNPRTLSWLVRGSRRNNGGTGQRVPFPGWSSLAPTILEACAMNRQLMLPQLAGLVTSNTRRGSIEGKPETVFQVDGPQAVALFGSEAEVLRLFVDPVDVEPDARGMVEAVRAAALEWQGEQPAALGEGGDSQNSRQILYQPRPKADNPN